MIRIPVCFNCKNYDDNTDSCPAYPEGIPGEVLFNKQIDDEECGKGFFYEEGKFFKSQTDT